MQDNAATGRQRPAQLGRRLHAGRLSGHALHGRQRADPEPRHARRRQRRASSAASSTSSAELNRAARRSATASRRELEARIASYELAFRMQAEAPEAVDLAQETDETQAALRHGRQGDRARSAGCACSPAGWSSAASASCSSTAAPAASGTPTPSIEKNHAELCRAMDKPVAGLLKDLKRRGLLDETLVDLGRRVRPHADEREGRRPRPQPDGFTMWMAGGGVKGGQTIGATDELGLHAVEDRLHVHDLHATILCAHGPRST